MDVGEDITVIVHPKPQLATAGTSCRFVCHAVAASRTDELHYQWIHYPRNAHGGRDIRGATNNCLPLVNISSKDYGSYKCEIQDGRSRVFTNMAKLTQQLDDLPYFAVGKVALLLGNSSYPKSSLVPLPAIPYDLVDLSIKLTDMGFKVISALNLTAVEARNLLQHFYKLIHEGVYGLVYLAGHGVEVKRINYLMCVDCSTCSTDDHDIHAICLDDIIAELQQRSASLLAVFVDMCRVAPSENVLEINELESKKLERKKDITRTKYQFQAASNLIVLYATSPHMSAFERFTKDESKSESVFSQCLKNCISERIPLKLVCDQVLKKFGEMKDEIDEKYRQVPEFRCDAYESRSLMDQIDTTNYTTVANRSEWLWEKAAGKTILRENERTVKLKLEEEEVEFGVYFKTNISNVLKVYVDTNLPCNWRVRPQAMGRLQGIKVTLKKDLQNDSMHRMIMEIEHLHALQHDLDIAFVLYKEDGSATYLHVRRIHLGRPLLASLGLTPIPAPEPVPAAPFV